MLSSDTLDSIVVAVYMQACWEDANSRRRDEEGKAPRTRKGYAKLLSGYRFSLGLYAPLSDHHRALQLWHYYNTETNPVS